MREPSNPVASGRGRVWNARMRLTPAKRSFVETWGEMGSRWGINRTMAQIHALLIACDEPLHADEIMEELKISRGNASMNLRELLSWSLVRKVVRLGERKEFYEAEKDIWRIFCNIVRERQRREVDPLHGAFEQIITKARESREEEAFVRQMQELEGFVRQAAQAMELVSNQQNARLLPGIIRALQKLGR
jgi:DNA-binding transcriptional regulator GbsR (MarR family)